MKSFKDKLFCFSNNIIKYCFGLFCFLYAISNIFCTYRINNADYYEKGISFGINIVNIVLLVLFLLIIYILIKKDFFKIDEKKILFVFLLLCLIVGLFWIFTNDVVLREHDDSYNCFNTALSISRGDLGVLKQGGYICVYPNNIGLVTYDLLNILIFGEIGSLYSIRIINLLFVLLGYYCLYAITNELFEKNRRVNCLLLCLMFISMQFVFYSFFIYGNCLSYSLALLSTFLFIKYLKERKISSLILSSLSISLAVTIKMNSLIILIAQLIYLFLDLLKNKKAIVLIFVIISFVCINLGATGLQSYWGNKVGVDYNDTKLPTTCWFAYGVNYDPRNPGHYTNQFEIFHSQNGFKAEYTSIEAKNFIKMTIDRFIEKPSVGLSFYAKKFIVSWANPQYEAFDQYRELHNGAFSQSVISGSINNILNFFWDSASNVVSIGLLAFILLNFKKIKLEQMLAAVIVLGGFFFHTLWEVKAIYLYQYFMYLLPYAAYGINLLFNDDVIIDKNEKEII